MLSDDAIVKVIGKEGAYSNNPNDSGGDTIWGITKFVARESGYLGDMRTMPQSVAIHIYKVRYWDKLKLDDVARISRAVALEMFDTSVNMGQAVAGEWLQIALNAFNARGKLYPDITEDGAVGPATLRSLAAYLQHRGQLGEKVLLACLNAQQGVKYLTLSRTRQKDEDFIFGWYANRVV